jgi:pyruvate dehydrogenase E2 component (dihydrolipoamide acetyltransferase)
VTRVILPKLGLTMDEGRLIAWHKQEGERVAKGEILFEVETDKADMEIEAPATGTVRRILYPADATAPIGTVIALIADSADEPLPDSVATPQPKPSLRDGVPPASGRLPVSRGPSAAEPLPPLSMESDRIRSSPAARKRAQELGVDIGRIHGTGPGGRVGIEDVEAASRSAVTAERREPLSKMRRAVAEAMTRSAREAPQFSISREVDMTSANVRRKAAGASYTDTIVSAAARALRAHPRLRSRIDGDAIVTSEKIDVGIAVALEAGLIVPVVRDADRKDLAALKQEREALEAAVQAGHARADAFGDAAITVSNLGTLGVDRFTALVNPPEAAILAVGRVADRVTVVGGVPAVRPMTTLTLSVDHRVADGADAARYLADIVTELERE